MAHVLPCPHAQLKPTHGFAFHMGEFRREIFQANHDIPIDTGEPYGHVSGCGSLFVEILRPSGPRRQMEPGMVSLLQHSSIIPYQIVHLVIDHSRLRSHQFRLSLSFSPSCACGEYESTRHFLFDCSLHSNARTPFKVACLLKISTWPPPLHVIQQIPSIWKLMTSFVLNSGHLSFRHIPSRTTHS